MSRSLLSFPIALLLALGLAACSEMDASLASGDGAEGSPSGAGGDSSGGDSSSYGGGGGSWSGSGGAGGGAGGASGGTNVSFGGAQDFGYFRSLLQRGIVPRSSDLDASGFFAEHHTSLPPPDCGERVCLQAMLGVMSAMSSDAPCTMLQLGLNSPITVEPGSRPPLTLAVVVDVSGSMAESDKLTFVQNGLELLVSELKDDDRLALLAYDTDVRELAPMGEVVGRRNELIASIRGLSPGGSTNLYGGLEAGYRAVLAAWDSGRQNRVIFLSDGQATAGITDDGAVLAMSRAYNSDGVGLTTVGVGTSFDHELMRGLAEQADGNHYFVEDAAAVEEVFTEELDYFTVPVAFDLSLQVREGSDYTFGRAVGAPLWRDEPGGGRLDVPSVFLAHRTSPDDVTPGGGRRGGGSALLLELQPRPDDGSNPSEAQVAIVDVSFRVPGTDELVTDQVVVNYPHAPWVMKREGHFDNEVVTKSFVMLNLFVALEVACDLFHAGGATAAISTLERVIAAAEDYEDSANGGAGDADIEADVALLRQLIAVIEGTGVANPETPIDEDPWPAD